MRVSLQRRVGPGDLQRRTRDVSINDHVVHGQRLGVAGDVQAGWLLVSHSAAQPQRAGIFAVGAHNVGALVDEIVGGVDAYWMGNDVVEELMHTSVDCTAYELWRYDCGYADTSAGRVLSASGV